MGWLAIRLPLFAFCLASYLPFCLEWFRGSDIEPLHLHLSFVGFAVFLWFMFSATLFFATLFRQLGDALLLVFSAFVDVFALLGITMGLCRPNEGLALYTNPLTAVLATGLRPDKDPIPGGDVLLAVCNVVYVILGLLLLWASERLIARDGKRS